jgi:hypothetical protein
MRPRRPDSTWIMAIEAATKTQLAASCSGSWPCGSTATSQAMTAPISVMPK